MNQVKKEKAKNKALKIKALDIVIVLLVLLAVLGVYFRYNSLNIFENKSNTEQYTISFSIENIRYSTPEHLHVGDCAYFQDSGELLGTFMAESENMENIALKCTAASEYFMDETGTWVEVSYPQDTRVQAEGKLLCNGIKTENNTFLVNGSVFLAANQIVAIQTETVTLSILITDIQLAENT